MNFILTILLTLTVVLTTFTTTVSSKGLREEFTWSRINYEWPTGQTGQRIESRQSYLSHNSGRPSYGSSAGYGAATQGTGTGESVLFPGNSAVSPVQEVNESGSSSGSSSIIPGIPYAYENNIPMGANVWNNKLFITVPRRRLGVPSTVNYVWTNSTSRHNVPLIPYPDWQTNILGGSSTRGHKFVSVYRVAIDSCDRLWFVDTGNIELPGNPTRVAPSSLVIMDLRTDEIIQRHTFNASSVLRPNTNLASVTVDTSKNTCSDAYAYMPDLAGYGMVVYSLRENRSWRVTHNYFYLEPHAGEFSVGGFNFQWNDGVFSVALGEHLPDGSRDAYFHSMSGTNLYKVNTNVFRNETAATRSYHGNDFQIVGDRGPGSQTSSTDLHETKHILFLGLVNQNALGCWNTKTPLSDISIVQKDDRTMVYPCDVKVRGDDVILLTNSMPVFLFGRLNYDQTNFRVWVQNVDKAIEGTKCAARTGQSLDGKKAAATQQSQQPGGSYGKKTSGSHVYSSSNYGGMYGGGSAGGVYGGSRF